MNLLLVTGGKHPYEESTPVLHAFLEEGGHSITVSESAKELAGDLSSFDAIVLNTLRQTDVTNNDLSENQRQGFKKYIEDGGSLLSIHISAASCPDWAEIKKITGGGWILGESWHPPFGWFQVHIDKIDHPIVRGVSDFWTYDECYCGLDLQPDINIFMHGIVEDEKKPLGWTHEYGSGKVVNIALGHAGSSHQHPEFQKLILNALEYLN
tara:strand:+ start:85 stop:714 length:630 start_codon:yes stop_codon:yes gene_type:complete